MIPEIRESSVTQSPSDASAPLRLDGVAPVSSAPIDDHLTGVRLAIIVLRHRALIAGMALLAALVTGVVVLLLPRQYKAEASFVPQTRKPPSSLSGLASQLGINLALADANQSPAFYVDLIGSRAILEQAVDSAYTFMTPDGKVSASLIDVYHSRGRTPALRRESAIKRLGRDLAATAVSRTGVVDVAFTGPNPDLARAVTERLLDLLNRFNLETRQSQASAERKFTQARLEETRQALRVAEDRVERFLQSNRDFRNSPQLSFQKERLDRDVNMQQQLFTTLAQAFHQAEIEEVRDTPVLTVLQQPEAPVRPVSRRLLLKVLLAFVAGAAAATFIAVARAATEAQRRQASPDFEELERLRSAARADLRRVWRPLARTGSGRG